LNAHAYQLLMVAFILVFFQLKLNGRRILLIVETNAMNVEELPWLVCLDPS
jgi:hypothetical protein